MDRRYIPDNTGRTLAIAGAASSASFPHGDLNSLDVDFLGGASFDRTVKIQCSFDTPQEVSPVWTDAIFYDINDTTPNLIASAAPGTTRAVYRALLFGRMFRINVSGGAAGNSAFRAVLHEGRQPLANATAAGGALVDTELPAAVALSDALANPTAPGVGAYTLLWDGTSEWLRALSDDTTNGSQRVTLYNGSSNMASANNTDATTQLTGYPALAFMRAYNGGGSAGWERLRTPNIFKKQSALSINAEATIWTPAAGKKFRVMGYHLVSSIAGTITVRDNTAGTIILEVPSGAGGSGVYVELGNGILSAAANNVLTATGPATATLTGVVYGTEE